MKLGVTHFGSCNFALRRFIGSHTIHAGLECENMIIYAHITANLHDVMNYMHVDLYELFKM
jgi:hypothetical protein